MKTSQFVTKLAISGALAIVSSPAYAATTVPATPEIETRETIVHVTKSHLYVELNKDTVLCSRADYAMPMLKVLIPGLSDITLLDHQNYRAAAPCVTTGESCMRGAGGASPEDILQGRPGTEAIEVTVTAKKIEYINHTEKTCLLEMVEDIETNIRGKKLVHQKSNTLEPRSFERCTNGAK